MQRFWAKVGVWAREEFLPSSLVQEFSRGLRHVQEHAGVHADELPADRDPTRAVQRAVRPVRVGSPPSTQQRLGN